MKCVEFSFKYTSKGTRAILGTQFFFQRGMPPDPPSLDLHLKFSLATPLEDSTHDWYAFQD